jgi:MFS family permease
VGSDRGERPGGSPRPALAGPMCEARRASPPAGHPGMTDDSSRGFAAFRHRDFTFYWFSRFLATVAMQMQAVAISWQVYEISHDAFDLGLIGLSLFLPAIALVLVTGQVADRYNRKTIIQVCLAADVVFAGILVWLAHRGLDSTWPIFAVLIALGIDRAFITPAGQAMMPNLVPEKDLANAVAWQSSSWQVATIGGPAIGGWFLGYGLAVTYAASVVLTLIAVVMTAMIRTREFASKREPVSWGSVLGGLDYIWNKPVVLGAISLDLFAVVLGGCVALYPIYATDILDVGAPGLGAIRAAPALGAAVCSLFLIMYPLKTRPGLTMFWAVALFGAATVGFGLSTWFPLSLVALFVMGAADMISVYVRQTLVQLATPDEMRGRVGAVSSVFITTSNEFGDFRAGMLASRIGAVGAVVVPRPSRSQPCGRRCSPSCAGSSASIGRCSR